MADQPNNTSEQAAAERLISLAEAAEACGLSHDHLRNLVRAGIIWGAKIGRNWVTSEAAVKAYISKGRKPGPKPKKSED